MLASGTSFFFFFLVLSTPLRYLILSACKLILRNNLFIILSKKLTKREHIHDGKNTHYLQVEVFTFWYDLIQKQCKIIIIVFYYKYIYIHIHIHKYREFTNTSKIYTCTLSAPNTSRSIALIMDLFPAFGGPSNIKWLQPQPSFTCTIIKTNDVFIFYLK